MACFRRAAARRAVSGPELPCSSRSGAGLIDSGPLVGPRAIAVLAFALTATGCRGWHGDTYLRHLAGKKSREEATYRFGLPGDGWRPVRKVADIQVAWIHDELGAVIQIHAQCDEQGDSSLDEYTDHLRIDWTDWSVVSQAAETVAGRAALRTVVDAELDGVKRRSEFLILKKNGCLFDLQYIAPPERFTGGRAGFEQVVHGFRFPLRGGA